MRGLPLSGTPDHQDRCHSPGSATPDAPSTRSPGDQDVARARRVLAQHRRQRYPHGRSCGWCQEQYPCAPRRTAEMTLHAAGAKRAKPAGVATVPGLSSSQRRNRSTVAQAQMLLLNTHH